MYARDLAGNTGASETVNFTVVAEQEPNSESEPKPFPTLPVATASAAGGVVVAAGLLIYFKKHKR